MPLDSALANIPGLAGYVGAQQAFQDSAIKREQLGALLRNQAQDEQIKQVMANSPDPAIAMQRLTALGPHGVAAATQLAQLREHQGKAATANIVANAPPGAMQDIDFVDRLALKDPRYEAYANKLRAQKLEATKLDQMQGVRQTVQPDPQEAEQAADQGTPEVAPITTRTGGLFADLINSQNPAIAAEAKALQSRLEAAPKGTPTAYYEARQKALADRDIALQSKPQAQGHILSTPKGYMRVTANGVEPVLDAEGRQVQSIPAANFESSQPLTKEAIRDLAIQSLYDPNATQGHRRDPKAMAQIANERQNVMREAGITSQDVVSGRAGFKADTVSLNKLTPQYDAVTAFEKNAVRNGAVLKTLADKADASGVPAIERWIRSGRQATGDPDVAEFNAQLFIYRAEAAKILTNPNLSGQLTDSARKEVEDFLKPGASAAQIRRVVDRLENDFENRKQTLEEQIGAIRARMAARVGPGAAAAIPGQPPAAANAPTAPVAPSGGGWTAEKERRFQELKKKQSSGT